MAALAAAGMLAFLPSLDGEMVMDDDVAVVRNLDVYPPDARPLWSLLKSDYWGADIGSEESHKSYRPLTVATFRANAALHGLRTRGYHIVNMAAHAACVVGVWLVAAVCKCRDPVSRCSC